MTQVWILFAVAILGPTLLVGVTFILRNLVMRRSARIVFGIGVVPAACLGMVLNMSLFGDFVRSAMKAADEIPFQEVLAGVPPSALVAVTLTVPGLLLFSFGWYWAVRAWDRWGMSPAALVALRTQRAQEGSLWRHAWGSD